MTHYVQLISATLTFIMSFMAVVSPLPDGAAFQVYRKSLHTLAWGTFLLTIDFILQFHFGWRFTGSELAPIFNLLFFSPAAILYILSLIMLQNEGHVTTFGHVVSVTGLGLVWMLTIIPPLCFPEHHTLVVGMRHVAATVMVAGPMLLGIRFRKFYKESRKTMREYSNDTTEAIERWMEAANRIGLTMVIFVPLIIFGRQQFALAASFVMVFGLLYFFIGYFIFGFSAQWYLELRRTALEESRIRKETAPTLPAYIQEKLEQWVEEKQYLKPHVTVETLAHDLGYNRSSLSLYFNQAEGVSFRDWINSRRLEESCRMLQQSNCNINEIAEQCGFTSAKYFGSVFRARYGVSPTEWRHRQA